MTTAVGTKTASDGWGDASREHYSRRFTRIVAVDDLRVRVHADLVPIVEHIVTDLSLADYRIGTLVGYPVVPRGIGLRIILDPPNRELIAAGMHGYGFDPDGPDSDTYVWSLTHDQAVQLSREMEERRQAAPVKGTGDATPGEDAAPGVPVPDDPGKDVDEPHTGGITADPEWFDGLPGDRTIEIGAKGRDVWFLQAYLQVERTGVYDGATLNAVGFLQGRKGIPADGRVNTTTWRQLIPRIRSRLFPGEHGRQVRLLTAAMIAAGMLPLDAECTARYTREVQNLVRAMQERHGTPRTARVGSVEWSYLLAHPW